MTSAFIGIGLILLIAVVTVVLGGLTRLIAGSLGGPGTRRGAAVPLSERIGRGNGMIARDLRPDETHPVARTARRDAEDGRVAGRDPVHGAAARHAYLIHALR